MSRSGRDGSAATWAFVGTCEPKGRGIHRFMIDSSTGELQSGELAAATPSPSWLAVDASRKSLYAANEVVDFNGGSTGSVSAFAVNATSGELTLLNTVPSGGAAPAHLSVYPGGKFVLVANYLDGNVAVVPIKADGSLSDASDLKDDADACGVSARAQGGNVAVKAPPGSFAYSGHDGPHAHMIASDPGGEFVVVNDLGLDRTIVWRFDKVKGTLSQPTTVSSSAGAGPRHFVFHPNGQWFYSINEEASTIAFMRFDAHSGRLTPQDEVSTLHAGFVGTAFASEIVLSPDGRTLYGLNRLHDSIAIFSLGPTGRPTWVACEWTRGSYPRSCSFEPGGRFLYVCNQRSDNVAIFRVAAEGRLEFTDRFAAVPSPAVIEFVGGR